MKRFILCTGIVLALGMTGCTAAIPNKKPDLEKSFSAEVKMKVGSEALSGCISRLGEEQWELKVSEPFALEGLTVTMDSEGTKLSMLGFEAQADFSDSALSGLKLVAEAYEKAADSVDGFVDNAFSGTNENGCYSVYLDENGVIKGITVDDYNIEVQFSGWAERDETAVTSVSEENPLIVE